MNLWCLRFFLWVWSVWFSYGEDREEVSESSMPLDVDFVELEARRRAQQIRRRRVVDCGSKEITPRDPKRPKGVGVVFILPMPCPDFAI